MSLLWIVRSQNLILLLIVQIVVSLILIYNGKNKLSFLAEAIFSIGLYLLHNSSIEIKVILCYLAEYVLMKTLIFAIVWLAKRFAFYVITVITHKKMRLHKFFIKKKHFLRIQTKIWNKVDYGVRIKKGYPAMVNKKHPRTGIHFDKDGFPKFKAISTVKLKRKMWRKTREIHFYHASKILYDKIQKSSRLASKFTKKEINEFKEGKVPSKYTWHHHQDKGELQLVEYKVHSEVRHRGGFAIWGKR